MVNICSESWHEMLEGGQDNILIGGQIKEGFSGAN
jgi:hypothetical protein